MITLEVTAIERMADKSYKITLTGKSDTIYDHMAFLHLTAEAVRGVGIGDKWSVIEHSVLAEPEPSGGPMALVYDRVLADREHAGISDRVPEMEDGRG